MLFSITMDKSASLQGHLLKIKDIKEQSVIGQKIEKEDMVVITLKILTCAYEHFIETMNITTMNVDLKFDELCNKVLQQGK
jgi:hypothetical protein